MYFIILIVFISLFTSLSFSSKLKPIFGILSLPEPLNDTKRYINESIDINYIKWLEAAGAEIVPIHVWYSEKELVELLSQINGVLLQGSFMKLNFSNVWEKKAKFLFNFSLENKLPIFGICMGFRMLNVMMSGNESLITKIRNHGNHHVEFTKEMKNSTLFSLFTDKDRHFFETEDSTVYIQRHGITDEMFKNEEKLVKEFKLTSYSYDLDGVKFIFK